MQDVIIIQVRQSYRNQEMTNVIHLGPLVWTMLSHDTIKLTSNCYFLLLVMIKKKSSSVM